MLTVHEVSELAGISVRTLHHYDKIGLLRPSQRTAAGYRLYDQAGLARLQQIMLYRELEFSLADIRRILDSADFDQQKALEQQIRLLKLRREHIDGLIGLARAMTRGEVEEMGFKAFDKSKMDEYAARAKDEWGATPQWAEYETRSVGRTREESAAMGEELLTLFVPFGKMAADGVDPTSAEACDQAAAIQAYISEHFYTCTDEIFVQLGRAYGAGGEFTTNIDAVAGPGAAEFASQAVVAYCS